MKLIRALAPVLTACLIFSATGASAGTVEEVGPKAEGPFKQDREQCSEDTVRSASGTVLGKTETCLFLYSFDRLSELHVTRDFGAAWLQTRFTPAAGWCTTELGAALSLSSGRLERVAQATTEGGKVTTRLTFNARGRALQEGRITQTAADPGGRLVARESKGTSYGLDWRGKTDKAVSLVAGVAYSYDFLTGPPQKFSYGFTNFALTSC